MRAQEQRSVLFKTILQFKKKETSPHMNKNRKITRKKVNSFTQHQIQKRKKGKLQKKKVHSECK